jgi:hypothetical protein
MEAYMMVDSEHKLGKNPAQSKQKQKESSGKFLNLANNMLDSVDLQANDELGENGFTVDSAIIKSKKLVINPDKGLNAKTNDNAGLSMDSNLLGEALGEYKNSTVNISSFDTNLYA